MTNFLQSKANRAIRRYLLAATATIGTFVVGAGGWAAASKITSAVVGPGAMVVEGHVKKIQHGEGGIVRDILVRDGMHVKSGDILMRLDGTIQIAHLTAVAKETAQLENRRVRLWAERDNLPKMTGLKRLSPGLDDWYFVESFQAEKAQFDARRDLIEGRRLQFNEQILQIRQQQGGARERLRSNEEQTYWVKQQLERLESLQKDGLVQFSRLVEVQRTRAQLEGEHGQLISDNALGTKRISEIEVEILQLDKDRRAEVLSELYEVEGRLVKLGEQHAMLADQIRRLDITSPVDGVVNQLAAHTIGGVLAAGDTAMLIVPTHDVLIVETRIKPTDIDQLFLQQPAILRFSAFNQRTTSELNGAVESISPDVSTNQQTGETWYSARIAISAGERAKLEDLTLMPGMPVETFIKAKEKTVLEYLLKPLTDQMSRAMRED